MPTPGRFITLEGGEGAGKSTQQRLLTAALQRHGIEVVATREPGGTPGGEAIRGLLLDPCAGWSPLSEVLLHFAARREHLDHLIRPALARGAWVISDRFADSTMAYQGYGLGADRAMIAAVYRMVAGDLVPDLTLVLDLPVETGRGRSRGRMQTDDRYEAMAAGFHQRVREGFLAIARAEPDRCCVIDAAAPTEAVAAAVLRVVGERLGIGTPLP